MKGLRWMLAVHAFWSHGWGLCLWAEDSERTVKSQSQALRTARPHPFAAGHDRLVDLHAGKCARATLLLPSLRTAPLDSPELVRVTPRPEPRKGPTLVPWSVPVVCFDPSAALVVLDEPAKHARYGADRLDSYFEHQSAIPRRPPAQTATDALLDQLPAVDLTARGIHLIDVLRPAYRTLGPAT